MIEGWRRQRERVETLSQRAAAARDVQHGAAVRLHEHTLHWLGQAETLAWFGVTGFVWGARVQENRRSEDAARPVRELAGAAWLVLSWRRLPERVRRLIRQFDPAGAPAAQANCIDPDTADPRR